MANSRYLRYVFLPLIVYLTVEVSFVSASVGEIQINLPIHLCSKHFCDLLKCVPFQECAGEVVKNGSVCGCCDSCVKILSEGEECGNIITPVGGKPAAKCKSELTCSNEKESPPKCKKIVTTDDKPNCIKETIKRQMLLEKYKDGIHKKFRFYQHFWIPDCDENGYYKPKQCKSQKCFCMDPDGGRLFGQQEKVLAKNMTCACSLAMYHKEKEQGEKWMTTLREHCTETGDYAELQCTDDICFCADALGQATSRVVKPSQKDILSNCYKVEDFDDNSYLSRCEEQLVRENNVRYTFARKGIEILRSHTITCDLDGSFSPRQCYPQLCRCTDRKGFSLGSYAMDTGGSTSTSMNCRCARDLHDNDQHGAQYSRFKCQGNGNFAVDQTFMESNQVWCVDEDGDIVANAGQKLFATTGTERHDRCKDIIECLESIDGCTEIKAPTLTTSPPF